jgi:hypothetical protein
VDINGLSRESVLTAIRELLSSNPNERPTAQQLEQSHGIGLKDVVRFFPNLSEALAAAGYEGLLPGEALEASDLLTDWGRVARQLGHLPTGSEYRVHGNYALATFKKKWGQWSVVPEQFRMSPPEGEWADVITMIAAVPTAAPASPPRTFADGTDSPIFRYHRRPKRPTYGNPMDFRGLRHEPVNEQGVVFLFGMIAKELGFLVEAVQIGYPDCEAKRQIGRGQWQRVHIEFEYESRSFAEHGHDPTVCDVIVCWRHNWSECPSEIEVLELASVIESLRRSDA